jgi:aspartate/methionine/tyrosine aminotransferase
MVSGGASLANFTALTAMAGPGDRILVERPTYPILADIPAFHGAEVVPLTRRPEDGWAPRLADVAEQARAAGGSLQAVALTRLHNPTGTDLPDAFLKGLAELAARHDFHVLLDEVYLDFLPDNVTPGHRISPRFVSSASLTKVYGFGGLRAGWLVGHPDVLAPMKELSFYLSVNESYPSQMAAVAVLQERSRLRDRARALSDRGRGVVEEWVGDRSDVAWVRPDGGLTAFLRLHSTSIAKC